MQVYENAKIFNLSFNQVIKNASITYINLINDLSIYFFKNNEKSFNKLGNIITKDDNLFYIGILILIMSFLLWIINITS